MTDQVTIDRAVVQQALEALQHLAGMNCDHSRGICVCEYRDAANNLSAALAQAEAVQPVAWADKISFENAMNTGKGHDVWPNAGDYETRTGRALIGLYTAPPQRKPLTEEEIDGLMQSIGLVTPSHPRNIGAAARARRRIARAVEAMLAAREADEKGGQHA